MFANQTEFSVVWPDYQRKISTGYTRFQQYEEFVDMTLAADGHYVKVHQFIIALASPYLKDILKSIPAKHPVIFLTNVSYNELCQILEYVYTGIVNIPTQQLENFMKSAQALKLRGINKDTDVPQSNFQSTFADAAVSEEPQLETVTGATAETMAISSELEQRMSFVKDAQECVADVDDIIDVELQRVGSSHTDTQMITENANCLTSASRGKDYDELLQKAVIDHSYKLIDLTEDDSMEQKCQPDSDLQINQTETPTPTISSKTIKEIDQNILTVSNEAKERKAAPKIPRPRIKVKFTRSNNDPAAAPSVFENINSGQSMEIENAPEVVSEQESESILHLNPSSRVEPSMPQLMSPGARILDPSAQSQETNAMLPMIFTGSISDVAHTSMLSQPQMPQIFLQVPAQATSSEPAESLTSAQPALSPNEFVYLMNSNTEERTDILDQLKEGAPQVYTLSSHGSVQIILNRFVYYPHFKAFKDRKVRWRCVDYRRLKCPAYVDTDGDIITKRANAHTHEFHDARILSKIRERAVYSTLSSAQVGAREMLVADGFESSENIEQDQ